MNLRELEKIMKLMELHDMNTVSYQDKEVQFRLQRKMPTTITTGSVMANSPMSMGVPAMTIPSTPVSINNHDGSASSSTHNYKEIYSPFVGTFYRSPAPDADPFVRVGDRVRKGQVLCIVEAMKLMNEIESEVDGVIREICIENATPVEFKQKLFLIE